MSKIERIEKEIQKTREKITEYQNKLRGLEAQKTEAENLQIVQLVRSMRLTPQELTAMLSGIGIPGICLFRMLPVHIVKLYLYEIPLYLIVSGKQIIIYFDFAMIGESQLADATCFTFFYQKVKHSIIQISSFKGVHSTHTDAMKQHIIDIVHLKVCKRFMIHFEGSFA